MGWFSHFTKILKRSVVAVATGGTSELLRAVVPKSRGLLNLYGNLLAPTTLKQGLTTGALVAAPYLGASYLTASNVSKLSSFLPGNPTTGRGAQPMGFNFGSFLSGAGSILSRTNTTGNPYISGLGGALSLVGSGFTPNVQTMANGRSPSRGSVPGAVMRSAPMMTRRAGRSMLTNEIFTAGTKVLGRLGLPIIASPGAFSSGLRRALGSIASLARRTPAGTIVNILLGLGLTVLEANMLTAWYAQRKKGKRMNPANSKALRRAARRIRSFHKLCTHTDLLKGSRRGGSHRSSRCGTCRKSPCSC